MTQRLQETVTWSSSNELNSYSNSDTKQKLSQNAESSKLPDLNLFNLRVVNNEIQVIKKTESEKYIEQIKNLKQTIDKQNEEIRDLKSANYDLNDTNNKIIKKVKEYKSKNSRYRTQLIDLKVDLKKICKLNNFEKKQRALKDTINDINEQWYSDEEVRSVSVLTLSDAGSIYYPGKHKQSPFNKTKRFNTRQQLTGHNLRSKSINSETSESPRISGKKLKFDIDDVFLPAESMGTVQFSELKHKFNRTQKKTT